MNIIDIFVGIFLLIGLFQGIRNGFFIEVASLIGIIAGLYGAIHFSYIAGEYLARYINWNERTITILAFVLTLLIIVFLMYLIGRLLTALVNVVLLGFLNKIAGGVFGLFKVTLILGVLLVFFERLNPAPTLISEETRKKSFSYTPLQKIGSLAFAYLPGIEKTVEKEATEGASGN